MPKRNLSDHEGAFIADARETPNGFVAYEHAIGRKSAVA